MFAFTKLMQTMVASGAVNDPYFYLNTLLLNTTSTNLAQNNTFQDSSGNGFAVSRAPTTGPLTPTQGTFSPYSQTGWSNYFAGNGNFLSPAAGNVIYNPGATGAWTFETWVYPIASGYFYGVGTTGSANSNSMACGYNGTRFTFGQSGGGSLQVNITASTTQPINNWYHYAVSKDSSNVIRLFINGVERGTATHSGPINSGNQPVINGLNDNNGLGNSGGSSYLSNLRWVKGGALYTSNFTPPTSPLTTTVSAGTCNLLFAQSNRFVDNSTTNAVFSPTGTPSVQAFSPFAPTAAYSTNTIGGSGYFNGSGNYLTVGATAPTLNFGTGDFTVECWIYPTADASLQKIYDFRSTVGAVGFNLQRSSGSVIAFQNSVNVVTTSSGAAPLNAWTHIVASRVSGNSRLFINGALQGTAVSDTATYVNGTNRPVIGVRGTNTGLDSFTGYITTAKVVIGSGVTSVTVPTSPSTSSGSNLYLGFTNANIYDVTAKNVLETVADAKVSTAQAKFGTTSMAFDGTGDYLLIPDSPIQQLGTGDFTIDGWFFLSTAGVAYGLVSKGATTTTGWSVNVTSGNRIQFSYSATSLPGTVTTLASGTWYYFAVVRSGSAVGNLKLYLGTAGSTTLEATSAGAVTDDFTQTNPMYVAANRTGGAVLSGYLEELRITKGFARDVTTVPTAPFSVQ
jgi:hypothetical protein